MFNRRPRHNQHSRPPTLGGPHAFGAMNELQLLNTREQIKAVFAGMPQGVRNLLGEAANRACPDFSPEERKLFAQRCAHAFRLENEFRRYYGDDSHAPIPRPLMRLYTLIMQQWNEAALANYPLLLNQDVGLRGEGLGLTELNGGGENGHAGNE